MPAAPELVRYNDRMRGLIQRVSRARVTIGSEVVGEIGTGLCVLVGVTHTDDEAAAVKLADKIRTLRVFADDEGAMNRSVADLGGEVLVVSQFTLYGDSRKGRRPSWIAAAPPDQAEPLIERLVDALRAAGVTVATGRFRADMAVELLNDGPVTLLLET